MFNKITAIRILPEPQEVINEKSTQTNGIEMIER